MIRGRTALLSRIVTCEIEICELTMLVSQVLKSIRVIFFSYFLRMWGRLMVSK